MDILLKNADEIQLFLTQLDLIPFKLELTKDNFLSQFGHIYNEITTKFNFEFTFGKYDFDSELFLFIYRLNNFANIYSVLLSASRVSVVKKLKLRDISTNTTEALYRNKLMMVSIEYHKIVTMLYLEIQKELDPSIFSKYASTQATFEEKRQWLLFLSKLPRKHVLSKKFENYIVDPICHEYQLVQIYELMLPNEFVKTFKTQATFKINFSNITTRDYGNISEYIRKLNSRDIAKLYPCDAYYA
ncbi:hypothetical protein [Carp edema virus]|nr:hypothetical protein [Carp edema virus]